MISLPDIRIIEQIYESANSLVYRAVRETDKQPLILKLLKQDYPTPTELYCYQNEYDITRSLNLEGVIKAYELKKYNNTKVMLLEDFGGNSLKMLLENREFSVSDFLPFAIKAVETLGKIHQQNIIHKDINPSNFVLNLQTGQIKIIDFGISITLLRENPIPTNPNLLEGTLAYISPEQTGRTNCILDYRTDLYSLGVSFYEWLTNKLPFESEDALELIYSHIAKDPTPPHQINPKIPTLLSEIVLKLMAKTPENRYQTAWGLKADLETFYEQLKAGKSPNFVLGKQDSVNFLQIPQKLYGRDEQIQSLLTAFGRVASPAEKKNSESATELMLISGYSGIGKTALVQELYKDITQKRGYIISGKFEQLHRDIPYQALIIAFQELMQKLLSETALQLQEWREKILAALGNNAQIIIDVIPEVELIIGNQPAVPELAPTEAQNRFNLVFQNFIQVFCKPQHPLVIFLDDLQWTDSGTLQLLQLFLTNLKTQNLLLIAAYRDNEVSTTHPLMLMLSEINKQGVTVNHLALSPLNLEQTEQLIADTLKCKTGYSQKLAELVWKKTRGNAFFIKEFLKSLYTEKLLTYERETAVWNWDIEKITMRKLSDNVVEFMGNKIQNLSESCQQNLKIAACIGNQFALATLAKIQKQNLRKISSELWEAMEIGLIFPLGDDYKFLKTDRDLQDLNIAYKFAHDRIQQAAYSLIAETEKQQIHWEIGQLWLENTAAEQLKLKIFDIVKQLNLGSENGCRNIGKLDRNKLAKLNLMAGKKAKISAAWQPAWRYLKTGIQYLNAETWLDYQLALALYEEAAEAAYLCGNFEDMENLASQVENHAKTLLDKIKIYLIKIKAYTAQNLALKAIETALNVLKKLKIYFPEKPTKLDIIMELGKTKIAFFGKNIANLIDLPVMTNPEKLAAMRLLAAVSSATYFSAPALMPLIVLKQVNLSLKYGNTSVSCYAYASYGMMLSGEIVGDIETGYQFGELALKLIEKFNAKELKARTIFIVNYLIKHWKQHLKETLKPLLEAYTIGLETGDLEFAAYSACVYCYHSYVIGTELSKVEQEMAMYSHALSQLKQESAYYYNKLDRQVVLNLMGRSENKLQLIGESYDEIKMLPVHLEAKAQNICHALYFYKFVLSYLFQDYKKALENANLVEQYLQSAAGSIPLSHFYNSLAHLAIYNQAGKPQQKHILHKVKANQKNIKKWAKYAPMTHLHKYYLVEAETHRVLGNKTLAIEYYDKAIKLAKENEYLNEEALANELAAKFYLTWEKDKIAEAYLTEAYYSYLRWGATAKTEELEKQYPQYLKRFTTPITAIDTSTSVPKIFTKNSGKILDFVAIMKASQAIASEIELDKLLTKLMKIFLETSGAQTGHLILETQGELRLEATANANSDTLTMLHLENLETSLPLSIINYVERTRKGLIEMNAAGEGNFTKDPYIKTHKTKSILCAPLLNKAQLIGIIYLENNLAPAIFPPERLEIIQLLSIQAAISLTNARLYEQVNENQNRLNKFFNAIPLGISVHNSQAQLIYANQMAQQLFDFEKLPQLLSEQPSENTQIYRTGTSQTYPLDELPLLRSINGEKATADDIELHQNQQITPLEITSTPIFNDKGTVEYAIATFQDITERKQAEKTLIENISLEQEINERKKVAAELQTAKQAAEAANRAKSAFLANMSHELRTPLNAILGFSQLLSKAENLSTHQLEELNIIQRSGNHLLTLINQVLDLSKIEAGQMTLTQNNFNLHRLLTEVEEMFTLKAKNKGLQLQIQIQNNVPKYIRTEEIKLRQVLINLLSNAIKFTTNGSIKVNVTTKNETDYQCLIHFQITDTGIGISPLELKNIFKPFLQTTASQKVSEGTGLGLTISHQFVKLMGGKITVSSNGYTYTPGKPVSKTSSQNSGTCFQCEIPVTIIEAQKIEPSPQHQQILSLAENQPKYRLLVVDDSEYNRQLLSKLLKPIGFEIKEAKNGQEAIEITKQWEPHLIWMDMRMPVLDGYQATQQIKNTPKGKTTPIIAVTASTLAEETAIILQAGCDDFVAKPFQEKTIFDILQKHLKLTYIYKQNTPPPQNITPEETNLNIKKTLAKMSKTWLETLHSAVLDADTETVLKHLEQIPKETPEKQTLKNWTKNYQFEKILNLLD